ncbi:MAG: hypothetical protein EXS00_03470 [Phycisphaerales bacterium]|nr:hypothetical protein [Phycisphaerales bacterium]
MNFHFTTAATVCSLALALTAPRAVSQRAETQRVFALLYQEQGWVEATIEPGGVVRPLLQGGNRELSKALAITAVGVTMSDPFPAALVLTTGEVLPGSIRSSERRTVWRHPNLGMIPVLEGEVAALLLHSDARVEATNTSDIVVLANGDRVAGLVAKLDDPLLVERTDGSELSIPIDRVKSISFVCQRRPQGAIRLWLGDGTIVDAASAESVQDGFLVSGIRLSPQTPSRTFHFEDVVGMSMAGGRITPLASLHPIVTDASDATAPRLGLQAPMVDSAGASLDARAVRFLGPGTFTYSGQPDQPTQSEQEKQTPVALIARASIPHHLSQYTNTQLVVRDSHGVKFRALLNAGNSVADLFVVLDGGPWSLELTEESDGPIGDTVILERALMLKQ